MVSPLFSRLGGSSNSKDVEIFYLLNPRADKFMDSMTFEDVKILDEENSKLQEIDYT